MSEIRGTRILLLILSITGIGGTILVLMGLLSGDGTILFPAGGLVGIVGLIYLATHQGPPPK